MDKLGAATATMQAHASQPHVRQHSLVDPPCKACVWFVRVRLLVLDAG